MDAATRTGIPTGGDLMDATAVIGAVCALGAVTLTLLGMVVAGSFRAGRNENRIEQLESDAKEARELAEAQRQAHWRVSGEVEVLKSRMGSTDKFRAQFGSKTIKEGT